MRNVLVFLIVSTVRVQSLSAQLDLLTPREVVRIIEQLSPVEAARNELQCPINAEVALADLRQPEIVDVEVRIGSGLSPFHDRYVVNRRTGVVTTWGDNSSVVGSRRSEALAAQLVAEARRRVLSAQESRCLALEAARSLPGWGVATGSVIVEPANPQANTGSLFWARLTALTPPTAMTAKLYVDRRTGHVLNGGSLSEVMSPGLAELLAKMAALRSPPLLSDQDALSIASKVPTLAAIIRRNNCSLVASSALTPEQAQIQPACDGHYLDRGGVVVDLRSGLVSDPDTGRPIDSPEGGLLASQLSSAARELHILVQTDVSNKCGEIGPR